MIIWDNETPTKIGQYLVISENSNPDPLFKKFFTRVDIEYWDGFRFDNMDERNLPIKWSYINKNNEDD